MNTRKANLVASDVMTRDPVCVLPSARIRELAGVLEEHEISGVPVVNQEGTLVGVVSKTDLIRRCSEGMDQIPPAYLVELLCEQAGRGAAASGELIPERLVCVDDFMTADPITVGPGTPMSVIAKTMHDRRIHRVVVVDQENYPIGVITSLDVLGALYK